MVTCFTFIIIIINNYMGSTTKRSMDFYKFIISLEQLKMFKKKAFNLVFISLIKNSLNY